MNFLNVFQYFKQSHAHKNTEKQRKTSKRVPTKKETTPIHTTTEDKNTECYIAPPRKTNPLISRRIPYSRSAKLSNPEPELLESPPSAQKRGGLNGGISCRLTSQNAYQEDRENKAYELGKLKISLGLHEGTPVQMLKEYMEQNLDSSSPPRPLWHLLGHDQREDPPPSFVLRDYFEPKRRKFALKKLQKRDERQRRSPVQEAFSQPESTGQLAVPVTAPVQSKVFPHTSESLLSIININERPPQVLEKSRISYCALDINVTKRHVRQSAKKMVKWTNSSGVDAKKNYVNSKIQFPRGTTKEKNKGLGDAIRSSAKSFRLNDPAWFGKSLAENRRHINKIPILSNYTSTIEKL